MYDTLAYHIDMARTPQSIAYYTAIGILASMDLWDKAQTLLDYDQNPTAMVEGIKAAANPDDVVTPEVVAQAMESLRGRLERFGKIQPDMTLSDASAKYGIPADYLRVAISRGNLQADKVGRDWLVSDANMATFASTRRTYKARAE
jgi:hypothetical protein